MVSYCFDRSRVTQRHLNLRRSRTTRMIVKLLFVYLVCVIPICVYNTVSITDPPPAKEVGIVLYCIYWLQYCVNNFIYVVSNEKYRCAYCQFVSFILCQKISPPGRPIHQAHRGQRIFSISGQNLRVPRDPRFRTPSECIESHQQQVQRDYIRQEDSRHGSISSISTAEYLTELTKRMARTLQYKSSDSSHHYEVNSSSNLSVETLVRSTRFSHSLKEDLRKAKTKLKRTFSC